MRRFILSLIGLALAVAPAMAQPGSVRDPIVVRMKRGSDHVRISGVLRQGRDCCSYRFKARAGQTLHWRVSGPTIRVILTYPDRRTEGPGLPEAIPLPNDGAYVFRVAPNLMADGAYGCFALSLTITPLAAR